MTARTTTVVERDLLAWFTHTLDIRDCSRVEFSLGLLQGESAGMRPETWPGHARVTLNKATENWLTEHDVTKVRAITYGAVKWQDGINLVTVIHYEASPAQADDECVPLAGSDGSSPLPSFLPADAPPQDPRCRIAGCGE